MIRKMLFAAALGLAVTAGTPAARADVDITINLGYGGFYGKNVSCATGARVVARRFNSVTRRDCRGTRYVYSGRRNGKWYFVTVSSATGRITAVKRYWRWPEALGAVPKQASPTGRTATPA